MCSSTSPSLPYLSGWGNRGHLLLAEFSHHSDLVVHLLRFVLKHMPRDSWDKFSFVGVTKPQAYTLKVTTAAELKKCASRARTKSIEKIAPHMCCERYG